MSNITSDSPGHSGPSEPEPGKGHLFTVSPHVNIETLLANASEDLLSISAIAANLADDVDGSSRSVALALNRMAEGVHLLVERALDHLESPELLAFLFKKDKPAVT
ncbi:hypothetical protein PS662_04007 [Pseudomonas fluorescens]|uniref:DUF3077 domain-containing protein n=1 Tax=Pseudomonas fluorescens TaxID=294 RepID=A0A5E6V896_PSEFL|nr:DUF6124 family protein [Pseudomonas fluorescens]VVN14125.1 hypothetical protein PS662_04007 [Pseudomonas fluorescens]